MFGAGIPPVEPTPGDVYGLVVAAVVLALVAAFAFALVRWAKPRAESPESDAQPVRLERGPGRVSG